MGRSAGLCTTNPAGFHRRHAKGIPRFPCRTRAQLSRSFLPRVCGSLNHLNKMTVPVATHAPSCAVPSADRAVWYREPWGLCSTRSPDPRGRGVGRQSSESRGRTNGGTAARPQANFAGEPCCLRLYFKHPRKESMWRDTCHVPCVILGDAFWSCVHGGPGLAGAAGCAPAGVAPRRAGPGLARQPEPLGSSTAIFLLLPLPLLPTLPLCRWVLPFFLGAGKVG